MCRPSDVVLDLLPPIPEADIRREDGTPLLSDHRIDAGTELEVAMEGAGLAAADLAGPDRTYYRYARLDREVIGYGGFELLGADAVLLRALAVMERFHLQGNGRNMVLLLLSRAFARGARTAFAFAKTADAVAFFAKLRFIEVDRSAAPPALAARFASVPRGTKLFRRRIAL